MERAVLLPRKDDFSGCVELVDTGVVEFGGLGGNGKCFPLVSASRCHNQSGPVDQYGVDNALLVYAFGQNFMQGGVIALG